MTSETHSVTYAPGLSTLSFFLSHIAAQRPPSLFYCPRPPSHHISCLTSVYLVPVLHLLPPSTPFWPYGTHPFFPHAQTISILSDLLYLLTPFLLQLSWSSTKLELYLGELLIELWSLLYLRELLIELWSRLNLRELLIEMWSPLNLRELLIELAAASKFYILSFILSKGIGNGKLPIA